MGHTATLTKTGQVTIPKWVRETLGVEPGQRIVFRKEKDGVKIVREKTVQEITDEIHALIPEEARRYHMENFAGMTSAEALAKWADLPEGKEYFEERMRRCL